MRDDTQHATEGRATRQLVVPTSEATDDTHLTVKEELTDTKKKAIERIKIGSNKICIQEDLAKEKMVFSKESRQAIFNMGNVGLFELKETTIQCPSCLHYVFEGTFLCFCGELLKLDPETITPNQGNTRDSEKHRFVHLQSPQEVSNVERIYGKCIIFKLVTHIESLQKACEDLRQSWTDGKMMRLTGNLSLSMIGRRHLQKE